MVRSGGRITFVRVDDVDWIEAQGDYICLHTQGKKHLIREKISDMETQLSAGQFPPDPSFDHGQRDADQRDAAAVPRRICCGPAGWDPAHDEPVIPGQGVRAV